MSSQCSLVCLVVETRKLEKVLVLSIYIHESMQHLEDQDIISSDFRVFCRSGMAILVPGELETLCVGHISTHSSLNECEWPFVIYTSP